MRVLITGGAGFIGFNLSRHFLKQGHEVAIYDTLGRPGCLNNLHLLESFSQQGSFCFLVGDVRYPTAALREAIEASDVVFHLAGQVAVTCSVQDPLLDFEINAMGTLRILELIRTSKGKKPALFFSSTNKVYGNMSGIETVEQEDRYTYKDIDSVGEDTLLDLYSPYGCSKGSADQYVHDYARIYGLRTVVFRQSCIYGPNQFGVEDQGWVAWFVIAATLGRPISIYGDGKQVRDVLYIDDLAAAFEAAWGHIEKTKGRIYNIGGGPSNAISLLDLLSFLQEEMGVTLHPKTEDWRHGDQTIYVSKVNRAEEEFGWRPTTDWKTGVSKLISWTNDNRDLIEKTVP